MGTTTTSQTRKPRTTEGDALLPAIPVEIFLGGEPVGAFQVSQDDKLSKNGNVLFTGRVTDGWAIDGAAHGLDTPGDVLNALTFKVNGVECNPAAAGLHLTAPQLFPAGHAKAGQVKPNTGGELIVSHWVILDLSKAGDGSAEFMVNLHTHKRNAFTTGKRAGQERHFGIRVEAMPKAEPRQAGPQMVGISGLTGLTVVER